MPNWLTTIADRLRGAASPTPDPAPPAPGVPPDPDSPAPPPSGVRGDAPVDGDNSGQNIGMNTGTVNQTNITNPPPPGEDTATLLAPYLNCLIAACNQLPLQTADGASHEQPLTLSDVYIALDATDPRERSSNRDTARRSALNILCYSQYPDSPRMLLLGQPGSGKSTLLNFLTLCLAEAYRTPANAPAWLQRIPHWTYGPRLPVRIVLREFAAFSALTNASKGTLKVLHAFLHDAEKNSTPCSEKAVQVLHTRLLDPQGGAILVFDGLDEVVGEHVLARTIETIAAAAQTYPTAPIVVTCRVLDFEASKLRQGLIHTHGFRRSDLLPLNKEQIGQFVAAWYHGYQQRRRSVKGTAAELQRSLATRSELAQMAHEPLLLTMMAIVHAQQRLPETRAELYHQCIAQLLIEWRRAPGEPDVLEQLGVPQFGRDALWSLMAQLGYATHAGSDRSATAANQLADLAFDQARQIIATFFANYVRGEHAEKRCEELALIFLDKIATRNGVLLEYHTQRIYRFAHRTFQEYLAGYDLMSRPEALTQWLQHTPETFWHEAIQLMIGLMASRGTELEKPLQLIQELTKRSPSERALAGELLALIGDERVRQYNQRRQAATMAPLTLWDDTVATLRDLIEHGRAPDSPQPLRIRAARTLATLGDPRFPTTLEQWRAQLAQRSTTFGQPHGYFCYVSKGTYAVGGWGEDVEGQPNTPEVQYTLPHFWIARYPITNAQFRLFVEGDGYTNKDYWTDNGWAWRDVFDFKKPLLWDDSRFNQLNQPVVGVTWYEAMAYAAWLTQQLAGALPEGYEIRLPTEAEWEVAAAYDGQGNRRHYPWGDKLKRGYAIFEQSQGDNFGAAAPVGVCAAGAAACGAADMAGNVWEWCASSYKKYPLDVLTFQKDFRHDECDTPMRGGSWNKGVEVIICGSRGVNMTDHRSVNDTYGVRVVCAPCPA